MWTQVNWPADAQDATKLVPEHLFQVFCQLRNVPWLEILQIFRLLDSPLAHQLDSLRNLLHSLVTITELCCVFEDLIGRGRLGC